MKPTKAARDAIKDNHGLRVVIELDCDNMVSPKELQEEYNGDLMMLLNECKPDLLRMASDFKILGARIKGKKYEQC